jgi:hypothetical protein
MGSRICVQCTWLNSSQSYETISGSVSTAYDAYEWSGMEDRKPHLRSSMAVPLRIPSLTSASFAAGRPPHISPSLE